FGGIQFLSILIGILRNKFVAVILGPTGMGLISLLNSTITFVSNATNFGIAISAVKNVSEAFESKEESRITKEIAMVRTWCLLTAVFGILVCIVFSKVLNNITFSWGDHTLHIILLSPIVGLAAVTGGEVAILKATRNLRKLALISVYNMLCALVVSVPVYYIWDMSGIVPCLVILALLQLLTTILYSYKLYPPKLLSSFRQLRSGFLMVKLGIAFVIAGIFTSGAEFVIRCYLNNVASLETVGLYSAGFMIVMTYGNTVFSSMETDYYPRLSAANNKNYFSDIVNAQSEVSILIISPFLVTFMFLVPIILPLLYSGKFTPIIGMVQIATLALYIRATKLPVCYISIAKGNSLLFMILEGQYAFFIIVGCIIGFIYYGLTGMGYAITIVGIIDYIITLLFMWKRYKFKTSNNVWKYLLCQYPIGVIALFVTLSLNSWIYWLSGVVLIIASTAISLNILYHKTEIWNELKKKISSKLNRNN
ncbi:MAG: oligosaccharide flippase family protein, partial [Prevotella sp.]|nr:oligosaccharide flippase family protein [Prevotella sp.]